MQRKVRHPYQIMEAEELVVGEQYAFVRCYGSGNIVINLYLFGGIIIDNHLFTKNPPLNTSPYTVTIHPNGMYQDDDSFIKKPYPTFAYWKSTFRWHKLCCYLGEPERINHYIIVPRQHWENDPNFHVLDWANPNDVVERKICPTRKLMVEVDWEQKLRAKRDVAMAMAKALGFS